MKKTKTPKKTPKVYTGPQVAALLAMKEKEAFKRGQANCPHDHISSTAAIGDMQAGVTYCLVKAVPVETEQPKAALGFGA